VSRPVRKTLASRIGVPVFMADVKGDLGGISQAGQVSAKLAQVLAERGLAERPDAAGSPRDCCKPWPKRGARAAASHLGRQLVRGVLGSLLWGGRRR